jgi:hypothetical protein
MTKLLIFIGENQRCDVELTIGAIVAMNGVRNAKRGNFIGAVFECEYGCAGTIAVIWLSKKAETITAESLDTCALSFALELQRALAVDLRAIDMEYSFNVALRDFQTIEQLRQAVSDWLSAKGRFRPVVTIGEFFASTTCYAGSTVWDRARSSPQKTL